MYKRIGSDKNSFTGTFCKFYESTNKVASKPSTSLIASSTKHNREGQWSLIYVMECRMLLHPFFLLVKFFHGISMKKISINGHHLKNKALGAKCCQRLFISFFDAWFHEQST